MASPEYQTIAYEFATGQWRNHIQYSCYECGYQNFNDKEAIQQHCEENSHGVVSYVDDDSFIESEAGKLAGVIITFGFLCWNTKDVSVEGLIALYQEIGRLERLGVTARVLVLDNGSMDGSAKALAACALPGYGDVLAVKDNIGISAGRNLIIDECGIYDPKYILLMDGDINIVPFSSYAMASYLESHPQAGCIGAVASQCTTDGLGVSRRLYSIHESRAKKDIACAWTQYGMFRYDMFDKVRFDEGGPFGEPGWGFEDDDLCYQMYKEGYENHYFTGMTYLHRSLRSSWPSLTGMGINIHEKFLRRRTYLIDKWKHDSQIAPYAGIVKGQRMPETYGRSYSPTRQK